MQSISCCCTAICNSPRQATARARRPEPEPEPTSGGEWGALHWQQRLLCSWQWHSVWSTLIAWPILQWPALAATT